MAKCNRTACSNEAGQWFNHSTRAYYCESCAFRLNKLNYEEAMELYGHNLCTLVKPKMVSPNDLLAEGKKQMLEGRDPTCRNDYILLMNFMVVNIQKGLRLTCCKLLNKILDMNLTDNDIEQIVEFHGGN